MVEYDEHPSRAATWRKGQFVVLPDAEAADCTVWISVEVGSAVKWAGLLARRLGPDRARVCAVPFWVYDLNLGDDVDVIESAEGAPVATGLVRDAGNYTFRVRRDGVDGDQWWREMMVEVERLDCWFDIRSPAFFAVSVRPTHMQALADYLQDRERKGEVQFETGRSQVPKGS